MTIALILHEVDKNRLIYTTLTYMQTYKHTNIHTSKVKTISTPIALRDRMDNNEISDCLFNSVNPSLHELLLSGSR